MRCCPVCYAKAKPIVSDTVMTGTKLEIKYVLSWIIVDFCLLIIDLFPSILTFLCKCLGIQLASNMIFLVAIIQLFLLALSHTILLSKLVESNKNLTQEIALLKKELKDTTR